MRLSKIICPAILLCIVTGFFGCAKLVKIPEPQSTITGTETFANTPNANSAMVAIYYKMLYNLSLGGRLSWTTGMSADELNNFGGPSLLEQNALTSTSGESDVFWTSPYYNIYQANAAIEGLQASTSLPAEIVGKLTGEAKFLRAFCNFYLVNLFGDVPLLLSTSYEKNALMARTPSAQIYRQIIDDLKDAKQRLPKDYSLSGGERIRANYWAATALLARAYLYTAKWDSAEAQSTELLSNTSDYGLEDDLNNVFLKNSKEAILQIQGVFLQTLRTAATPEGYSFIPPDGSPPNFYLSQHLLDAFEHDDQRRVNWVNSMDYDDGISVTTYYYPYKYKVRLATADNVTEYPMLLRLAEQYLIRSEARAQQNINLQGAIDDVNAVRHRAVLSPLPGTLNQSQVLAAVAQENRIEFFAEYGHRWLDLKRTNKANEVLGPIKPLWKPSASLFPIPFKEVQTDPNLNQNPGY